MKNTVFDDKEFQRKISLNNLEVMQKKSLCSSQNLYTEKNELDNNEYIKEDVKEDIKEISFFDDKNDNKNNNIINDDFDENKFNKLIENYRSNEIEKKKCSIDKLKFVNYDNLYKVAKAFNFSSSLSKKKGNKLKFYRLRTYKDPGMDNLVLLSKSEINTLYSVHNEEELNKILGKENILRIDNIIKEKILI